MRATTILIIGLLLTGCTQSADGEGDGMGGRGGGEDEGGGAQAGQGGAHEAAPEGGAGGTGGEIAAPEGGATGTKAGAGGDGGGGGTAGAQADAGVPPDAAPAKPIVPGCENTVVCDSFESLKAGELPPYGIKRGNASPVEVSLDSKQAFTGKNSMKFKFARGDAPIGGLTFRALPQDGKLYVRYMMRTSAKPSASGGGWFTTYLVGPASDGNGKSVPTSLTTRGDGGLGLRFNSLDEKIDCRSRSNVNLEPNRWTCVELTMNKDAAKAYELKVDGTTVASTTNGCGGWPVLKPQILEIGLTQWLFANTPLDFWIDDVVIAAEPVGCPKSP